jgi:hypothetical protein
MTPKRKRDVILRPEPEEDERPKDKYGFVFKDDLKWWMYTETKIYHKRR